MPPADKLRNEFAKVYDELADAIFRHCYFRLSDRERAKELMQETFIRTWAYVADGNYIRRGGLKAFIYKTANNLVIDEYRKRRPTTSLENMRETGFEVETENTIEKDIDLDLEASQVLKVLDGLDRKYREVIIMRYIDQLSPGEIAQLTGETPNNISVQLNRGIKRVREVLEKRGKKTND